MKMDSPRPMMTWLLNSSMQNLVVAALFTPREATVRLHRFDEMLPNGKSELPIVMPTADLLFSP